MDHRFETFNSFIRAQNIYGNKHAPSRDIAHKFAVIKQIRYICEVDEYLSSDKRWLTNGWLWNLSFSIYVHADFSDVGMGQGQMFWCGCTPSPNLMIVYKRITKYDVWIHKCGAGLKITGKKIHNTTAVELL